VYRLKDRTIQEVLQTLHKIVVDKSDLARWTLSIEKAAKILNKDKSDNITLEYHCDERINRFFVRDALSRDNLVKSIQVHMPLLPESVQSFFSVFKYNLKKLTFDKIIRKT
jgi:hypothetical protein